MTHVNPIYGEQLEDGHVISSSVFWSALTLEFLYSSSENTKQICLSGVKHVEIQIQWKYFTCKMPPLHNNFRLCAENIYFLVLIYHGIFCCWGWFFVSVFDFRLPPIKRKNTKKSKTLFLRYQVWNHQ